MKPFLTTSVQLQLQAIGRQLFADDPKVVAIISHPSKDITFYITEYRSKDEEFFGYIKGKETDTWGRFPCKGIEQLWQMNQEQSEEGKLQPYLESPAPISTLVPELKPQITNARLARLVKRHSQQKG